MVAELGVLMSKPQWKTTTLVLPLLLVVAFGCDSVVNGDGQVVARVEAIAGAELRIILAGGTLLSAVCHLGVLDRLEPGISEEEATRRLGGPSEVMRDDVGDRWARWHTAGGLLEIAYQDVGSGPGHENRLWVIRFTPTDTQPAAVLKQPLHRYAGQIKRHSEVSIESPSEGRRLWITLQGGQVRHIYLLARPE
jgi:hypothetical protein